MKTCVFLFIEQMLPAGSCVVNRQQTTGGVKTSRAAAADEAALHEPTLARTVAVPGLEAFCRGIKLKGDCLAVAAASMRWHFVLLLPDQLLFRWLGV
jgi:hypothetical protein